MRAVVIEIKKHYCIAITPDGRFIKQHIEQGELEIGDEIMLESGYTVPGEDWIKTLAIAAATIIVIGFGSWGIFRIFGWFSPGAEARNVAAADEAAEEKIMAMEAEEMPLEETSAAEGEREDFAMELQQVEEIPTGPGEIDADFYLELGRTGEPVEVIAGNLLFLYWVAESEEGIELLLRIEELEPELSFTGYVEAIVLDKEGQVAGSRSFDMNGFKRGDSLQEFIPLVKTEGTINILINGIFK